jgi:putative membrane protein
MQVAAALMVVIVAGLHAYFLVLEMFLWRTPFGRRTFNMTQEVADSSAVLAANQAFTTDSWRPAWCGV